MNTMCLRFDAYFPAVILLILERLHSWIVARWAAVLFDALRYNSSFLPQFQKHQTDIFWWHPRSFQCFKSSSFLFSADDNHDIEPVLFRRNYKTTFRALQVKEGDLKN